MGFYPTEIDDPDKIGVQKTSKIEEKKAAKKAAKKASQEWFVGENLYSFKPPTDSAASAAAQDFVVAGNDEFEASRKAKQAFLTPKEEMISLGPNDNATFDKTGWGSFSAIQDLVNQRQQNVLKEPKGLKHYVAEADIIKGAKDVSTDVSTGILDFFTASKGGVWNA